MVADFKTKPAPVRDDNCLDGDLKTPFPTKPGELNPDRNRCPGDGTLVLPSQGVRNIVKRIEYLSGIPVVSVGIGPDRRASIAKKGGAFDNPETKVSF